MVVAPAMDVDHHNDAATSLVGGVISHVSSKHTPKVSPRPDELLVESSEIDESDHHNVAATNLIEGVVSHEQQACDAESESSG